MKLLPRWELIALVFFCIVLGILSIFDENLAGRDEPRVAGIAREMAIEGNYLLPKLNGEPFLEYPSLGYIPAAFLFSFVDEPSDFLAHIPGVFFGTATVVLLYFFGSKLKDERTGIVAGASLLATLGFINLQNKCLVDPALTFWITLSLYGFWGLCAQRLSSIWGMAFLYLGMAFAFFVKGLVGVALPVAVMAFYLLYRREKVLLLRCRPWLGSALFLLPVVTWAAAVWIAYGDQVLGEFLYQSVWRFVSSEADHSAPFYFYLPKALYVLMPWSLLFAYLLWLRFGPSQWKDALRLPEEGRFALIWSGAVLFVLSVASSKRVIYLGPMYPGIALLAAVCWMQLCEYKKASAASQLVWLSVWVSSLLLAEEAALDPYNQAEEIRPMFEQVLVHDRIELFRPTEALAGAAVFYCGRLIPQHKTMESVEDFVEKERPALYLMSQNEHQVEIESALSESQYLRHFTFQSGKREYQIWKVESFRRH